MIWAAKGNKGFALVLALVVTTLMVAVVVELIHNVYVDVSLSRGYRDGQQSSLCAESGIAGGIRLLQQSLANREYSALSDMWATPFKLDDETGIIDISVVEESGKININGLIQPNGEFEPFTLSALKRLCKRLNISEDILNTLADWLDKDDVPRTNGAETPYYKTLKPPYVARNGNLKAISELSLVKGFTPEVIARLRPFITVYADLAGAPKSLININTASKEVIVSLDDRIDDRMAERIMEERRLKPFKATTELSRVPGLDTIAIGLLGNVSVKGNLYRITSIARVQESARTVEAVVRMKEGTPETLFWQEY